jgi:hypothetical protein
MTFVNLSRLHVLPIFLRLLSEQDFTLLCQFGELQKLRYLQKRFDAYLRHYDGFD